MQTSNSTSPFLQRVRNAIRVRHYSIRTEQAYVDWIRRFILFHGKRHPNELGEADVGRFLTWLAVKRNVAPSTQNQALNALVFLYRHVIDRPLGDITNATRAKKPQRLPVVLTQDETKRRCISPTHWPGSIRTPPGAGPGSTYSRLRNAARFSRLRSCRRPAVASRPCDG